MTVQPDSTGSIKIPPDCVPFDAALTTLSASEGATTDEAVQLPTIQPATAPDALNTDLLVPSAPISLDPADHIDSLSSLTEGAPVTNDPPLFPTEGGSTPTLAKRRSQRSIAGQPPD